MKRTRIVKLLCLYLAAYISASDIAWAADPRQLLFDAKKSFQTWDEDRRLYTVSEAQSAELRQETEIQEQQSLQDITTLNFSLTTPNGDLIEYLGGAIDRIRRADGTLLGNIRTGEEGRILEADMRFSDGSIEVFRNGEVIGYERPDRTQVFYENGLVQKVVSPEGTETAYTYIRDSQGNLLETILENAFFRSTYDSSGRIAHSLSKTNGFVTGFEEGIIRRITRPDGSTLFFDLSTEGQDVRIVFGHFIDPQGRRYDYRNHELKSVVLSSGWRLTNIILNAEGTAILDFALLDEEGGLLSESGILTHPELAETPVYSWAPLERDIPFEYALYGTGGLPKEILQKDLALVRFDEKGFFKEAVDRNGKSVSFRFNESSLSNILGAGITSEGVESSYDAEGQLSSIKIGDLTIHYKPDSAEIDFIEKSDGSELHDLVFDAAGNLAGAEITDPEGSVRLYEDGVLKRLIGADEVRYDFLDEKLLTLTTPEALVYHFDHTPEAIVAELDPSIVPDALTAVRMEYDTGFNLRKLVRQNQEIMSFLDHELVRVEMPDAAPAVYSYEKDVKGRVFLTTITQGNVSTIYDAFNQPVESVISPDAENPNALKVVYKYGKIREIHKNGILTLKYSYEFNAAGEETTLIDDLEENTHKVYRQGDLLTSLDNANSVLSTYSYADGKVSEVVLTRLGRPVRKYLYSYEGDLTIVTDETGVKRTYSSERKLVLFEKDGDTFSYVYNLDDEGEEITEEKLIRRMFKDGTLAQYDKGQITQLDLPDGTRITDVVLDDRRALEQATATLPSGLKKVFSPTETLEEIQPDGRHFYYSRGRLVKAVSPDGTDISYAYTMKDTSPSSLYDAGPSGHLLTYLGGARPDPNDSAFGFQSLAFDGNGDYVSIPASGDFSFGEEDFTVDLWYKPDTFSQNRVLLATGDVSLGSDGWGIKMKNGGNIEVSGMYENGWGFNFEGASGMTLGTWHHVALVRSGNELALYVDGQKRAGTQYTGTITSTKELLLGKNHNDAGYEQYLKGKLDEIRVSKGLARWTGDFTPPSSAGAVDSYTKLLVRQGSGAELLSSIEVQKDGFKFRFDPEGNLSGLYAAGDYLEKVDGIPVFADESSPRKEAVYNGNAGLGAESVFSDSSLKFHDGGGDYVSLAQSHDWAFGTGNFTVDFWVRPVQFNQNQVLITTGDISTGSDGWGIKMKTGGGIAAAGMYDPSSGWGFDMEASSGMTLNDTWHHIAFLRSDGTLKLFVDGVLRSSAVYTGDITVSKDLLLGRNHNDSGYEQYLEGNLDEIRISKGVARWSSDFSVPTSAAVPDSYTKLLVHKFLKKIEGAYHFKSDKGYAIFDASGALLDASHEDAAFEANAALLGPALARAWTLPFYSETAILKEEGIPPLYRFNRPPDSDRPRLLELTQSAILERETVVSQEYSSDGALETQTKADSTTTLFDNGKPSVVLDERGNTLIEYSYDTSGNLQRVHLRHARDALPDEIQKARSSIEEEREKALLALAQAKNLAVEDIRSQVESQKDQIKSQISSLMAGLGNLESQDVHGKAAKSAKSGALDQYRNAINDLYSQLDSLNRQESDAYAQLDAQVRDLSDKIVSDAQAAFDELTIQEAQLKKEIMRQEVSPVVYDHYRRILGRDPDSAEYENWLSKVDYAVETAVLVKPTYDPLALSFLEASGMVVAEAESFHQNQKGTSSKTWGLVINDGLFSDGTCLVGGPDTGASWNPSDAQIKSPRLDYRIKFENAGVYYIWVRGFAPDGNGDSLHAGLDGTIQSASNKISRFSTSVAKWSNKNMDGTVVTVTVDTAGEHTLNFWMREDGFKLDKFILTHDSAFVPSDFGPQESARDIPLPKTLSDVLREHLESSSELAERQAYVQVIKDRVTQTISGYLGKTDSEKLAFAQTLGLSSEELTSLSSSDAAKILSWLNSRSLHFGQSAFLSLESLLDQKGITYTREDIAEKAILIDILTGVISPLDEEGDLILSVHALQKVGSLYGLQTSALKLAWDDLLGIYQENPSARIVAHINGIHFVVITGIDTEKGTITYLDMGAGKDKQNELVTANKSDWMKVWEGNVFTDTQNIQYVQDSSSKLLSVEETQRIRGSFFAFLIPFIIAAFSSVGGAIATIAAGIGSLVAGIGTLVGGIISTLANFVFTIGSSLGNLGAAIFQGIHFGVASLFNGLGSFFGGESVFGSLGGSLFGGSLFDGAIKVGLNLALNAGLDALGVSPEIAGYVSAFTTGGLTAGLGDLGAFVINGLLNIAPMISQDLGLLLDLPETMRTPLSFLVQGFTDGLISGNLGGAFVQVARDLPKAASLYGLGELGTSLGFDPSLTNAFALPLVGALSRSFDTGRIAGEDIVQGVKDSFSHGGLQLGLDFVIDELDIDNPLLEALSSAAITSTISSLMDPDGLLFEDLLKGARDATIDFLEEIQTTDFAQVVFELGIAEALERSATSVFSRQALEEIHSVGGIADLISGRAAYTSLNGVPVTEVRITEQEKFYLDSNGNLYGVLRNGELKVGQFRVDNQGNAYFVNGAIERTLPNGQKETIQVQNGSSVHVTYSIEGQPIIEIKVNRQNELNIGGMYEVSDGIIYFPNTESRMEFSHDRLVHLDLGTITLPDGTGISDLNVKDLSPDEAKQLVQIVLLNGFAVQWGLKGDPPGTVQDIFQYDSPFIERLNELQVPDDAILPIPFLEETPLGGDAAYWMIDTLTRVTPLTDFIVTQIKNLLQFQTEPFVPLAYSGSGQPLLRALDRIAGTEQDKIETAILVGVPLYDSQMDNVSSSLKRIVNIYGDKDPGLTERLALVPPAWDGIPALPVKGGSFYTPTIHKEFTSAYGLQTINIELVGVDHGMYFLGPDHVQSDPDKAILNNRANDFIARLTQAALTEETLNLHLRELDRPKECAESASTCTDLPIQTYTINLLPVSQS